MEVTGRDNPAVRITFLLAFNFFQYKIPIHVHQVLIIFNDGYYRYTEYVKNTQNMKEGAVTHWDVDDHQAALYSDGLCQKTHAFFLTKPIDEENGTITMRMDGMKYRKKVEGGEIVSPKPVRNKLVTDDDDDDESGKSNKPVEISI